MICGYCKKDLPKKEFWKNAKRSGGYNYGCKSCLQLNARDRRQRNSEHYRKRDKEFYIKFIEKRREKARKRYHKNKEKAAAHSAVSKALMGGLLKKNEICEWCKERPSVHAHHPDYSKKLEVIWLCGPCHMRHHHGIENR